MTTKEWILKEVEYAFGAACPGCPKDTPVGSCDGCPYTEVFGPAEAKYGYKRATCLRLLGQGPIHQTSACFLAAIYDVEL